MEFVLLQKNDFGGIMMKFVNRIREHFINREQKKIKEKIEKEGLTDELLERQVRLNQKRNKHDISDKTKRIYKRFVQ